MYSFQGGGREEFRRESGEGEKEGGVEFTRERSLGGRVVHLGGSRVGRERREALAEKA